MATPEPPPAVGGTPAPEERGLGFVTRRPVAISMFMLSLAVFGLVSFLDLRQDLLPEISYPTLTVRTSWAGSAPEDVEQRVSMRVQEALGTLNGLVRSSSTSRAGVSDVLLEFDWGTPMTFAVQDVREKLDGVFLPDGAERPLILRYDPNLDPILRIGLTSATGGGGEADLIDLRWLADQRIQRELEAIEGVAAVQVRGGLEEEIRVQVDPNQLAARRIDPSELSSRLAQENINAAGGSLLEGSTEYIVRTVNEFESVEEIADLAIAQRGAATVRVRDVGSVSSTHKKREVVTRIGGREAVELAIYRESGANIVELATRVRDAVFGTEAQREKTAEIEAEDREETLGDRASTDYLAWRLRDDVDFELLSDQSVFIRGAIRDVQSAAGIGAVLAVLVILLFLRRLAATLIIAVSIPLSVVVTFAPMYLAGVSLNIMSLGGLALGVGMLVDNAIVVLESITRCREEGDSIARAAVRGAREVAGAVTASTLTTIAVFAPIVFVTGIAGQIFGDQALAVVTSLAVSLLVAVLFIPMLASRPWLAGGTGDGTPAERPPRLAEGLSFGGVGFVTAVPLLLARLALRAVGLVVAAVAAVVGLLLRLAALLLWPLDKGFELFWAGLERAYPRVVRVAVAAPPLVVVLAALLMWDAARRVPRLGLELLPEIHQGEFTAFTQLDVGSPLPATDAVLSELDAAVRLQPEVRTTALVVGVEEDTLSRDVEGPNTARLTVRLADDARGAEVEERVSDRVRELVSSHPATESVEIRRPTPFALASPIAVEVRGHDLEKLSAVAERVYLELEALPAVADLRTSERPGHPELRIAFDRDALLEYGLDLGAVSTLVRNQVQGDVSTRFSRGDERIDVRVIADEAVLGSLDDLLALLVNPGAERPVPLSAIAEVRVVRGPAEIRRVGNSRAIVLEAESRGIDLGGTSARIEEALASLTVPDDVAVVLGGQKREMDEAQASMRFALLLAVFLVYVVMAAQFESLVQPFVILLTVPLAGVGVVYALQALEIPLSVVVFIGLIMLAGIVVNNAIVLVDRINQNRARGLALDDSIVEAGKVRLRPILMTTTTTALGLLPLTGWLAAVPVIGALGSGEGAEIRAPMAIAVITGLLSSTVLTLVVIPSVYRLVAGLERRPRAAGEGAGA